MDIQFQEGMQADITCVPNAFIDELLGEANGEYVRVYLYLLRHCSTNIKLHIVADELNLTDHDVVRAVSFWEKKGIFQEGVTKLAEEELRNEEAARQSEAKLAMKRGQNYRKTSFFDEKNRDDLFSSGEKNRDGSSFSGEKNRDGLSFSGEKNRDGSSFSGETKREIDEEMFEGILYVAKHLLPGGVSRSHVQKLEYMVEYLAMDAELIEFLLDYCAGLQKTAPRYMEQVALDWHAQGIRTVKQAQEHIRDFELTKSLNKRKAGAARTSATEKAGNRFINFKQDEVDYDSLAKQKALKMLQQGGR